MTTARHQNNSSFIYYRDSLSIHYFCYLFKHCAPFPYKRLYRLLLFTLSLYLSSALLYSNIVFAGSENKATSTTPVDKITDKLPEPLPLEIALKYANRHPRLKVDNETNKQYRHQQPLYLNCHNFAYRNVNAIDTQRHDTITPLVSPEKLQQLFILQSYLDVHLADLVAMADNEFMSSAYIQYDRAKNRMELKQYSELVVAEKETNYYEQLQRYRASNATQRITRTVLAQEIASDNSIPRDIIPMPAWNIPKQLPLLETILKNIDKNNQWLKFRKKNSTEPQKKLIDLQSRQLVIELLLQLEILKNTYQQYEKKSYFRDLKLEQSRTLYEQEVKSDLGDSMAQQTRTQFKQQQVSYCLNIAWAELNILQGKPILQPPTTITSKNQQASP